MSTRRVVLLVLLFLAGCGETQRTPPPKAVVAESVEATKPRPVTPSPTKIEKIAATYLPNPVRVHERVISGGLPEGDAAFAELKAMGVNTIISVDGAKPDVATAAKYNMRYVHLPHSYDGVPKERAPELAKAIRDLPGQIYVHCHHGKHRSPAASAVACLGAGLIGHDEARQVLAVAGTGENYRGLFQSVDDARPFEASLLDSLEAEFPSTAKLPAMAEAMVEIEHVHDHLKLIEKAGWKIPTDHPALTPDHESLLLREHFTELLRTDDLKGRPEKFRQLTREAEMLCQSLEETLKASPIDATVASRQFSTITANCKSCHQVFRDIPQAPSR